MKDSSNLTYGGGSNEDEGLSDEKDISGEEM